MTNYIARGRQVVVPLMNKSAGAVAAGDTVILSSGTAAAFTTTTSAGQTNDFVGVVYDATIAQDAIGLVIVQGFVPLITLSSSASLGDYVKTHSVAKQSAPSATRGSGSFGQVLGTGTTPAAFIWSFPDAATGIGGASGSTDNAIIRADGTGGATVQSSLATVDDSGGVNIPTGQTYNINGSPHTHAAGASGLLAVKAYGPASIQIYSITGTSLADVDATNLIVTFTAPASGNVVVKLSAWADQTIGPADYYWGLREGTNNLAGSVCRIGRAVADQGFVSVSVYLTGLGAGSHSYKWSAMVASGTSRIIMQDGTSGTWAPGVMEVWAAP